MRRAAGSTRWRQVSTCRRLSGYYRYYPLLVTRKRYSNSDLSRSLDTQIALPRRCEQRSINDRCMRAFVVKNFENKAETTQRVWEDYAELIAVALVNVTITTDATAMKSYRFSFR